MEVKEDELKIIIKFLTQMDISEENKTELLNSYLIADVSNRILALQMMNDFINDQKSKDIKNVRKN